MIDLHDELILFQQRSLLKKRSFKWQNKSSLTACRVIRAHENSQIQEWVSSKRGNEGA